MLVTTVLLAGLLASPTEASQATPVSFRTQVAPILTRKCLPCHTASKTSGGLDLSTFARLRRGGKGMGTTILEPGDPDASGLIESVRPGASPRMPLKLPPLGNAEIAVLESWVRQGAKFDGPSETETPISSLVDPLRDLPKVAPRQVVREPVTDLALSPDGKTLAVAAGRVVRLIDAESGKELRVLADQPGPVNRVILVAGGTQLVAAGGRAGMFGSVAVWDQQQGKRLGDWRGHADAILDAAVSPDGKTLATAGYDRIVVLWDLASGRERTTLRDHTDAVRALAFSPDGRRLATAGSDRTVKLWEAVTGKKLDTLSDATGELNDVGFTKDGAQVLAGGADRSLRAWDVAQPGAPLSAAVIAHDAPVLRLAVSPDGQVVATAGQDRTVRLWSGRALSPVRGVPPLPDWPQALAFTPDGSRLAVGLHDGSVWLIETASGKTLRRLFGPDSSAPGPKPALVRAATLNPPSPRGTSAGNRLRVTLTGNGVGEATAVVFFEPGITATPVRSDRRDSNRLEVDVQVAATVTPGLHRFTVNGPLGVPTAQTFAVDPHPVVDAKEPDDDPAAPRKLTPPFTLAGSIERPGDVDRVRFPVRRGESVVVRNASRALGSALVASLTLTDERGKPVAALAASEGVREPVLSATAGRDETWSLEVADLDQAGSGSHFYRVSVGVDPIVQTVHPLAVNPRTTAELALRGANLGPTTTVALAVDGSATPGTVLDVPWRSAGSPAWSGVRRVVVAEGPQTTESEPNDEPARGGPVKVPGGVSGVVGRPDDVDHYRFHARRGERVIVEVFGRRLGSPVDTVVDVLDEGGRPVPRVRLRPLTSTEVAFRDHNATTPGIRLTQWRNLAPGDVVLIGREVTRIAALPRNPDDDCQFLSDQGRRAGFLETTPEHHPMGQPIYKVEVLPPDAPVPPGGEPPVTLPYRNDDGGPALDGDSRLTFDAPKDGDYVVRVADARGQGGEAFAYHLVLRRPRPDFTVSLGTESPNVPRGGTTLVPVTLTRLDGYDGAVEVTVSGLPPGVVATPTRVEPGTVTAQLALSADASAPAFSPPTWTVKAVGEPDRAAGGSSEPIRHELDPGGTRAGWVTVTPAPNLTITATPDRVTIRPGGEVTFTLRVARGAAFAGRVPIEVRNLPPGVRVLNVGLNGVLVPESQTERAVTLAAEPWASPGERPFYAVGKAESAGTEHSSAPTGLTVGPAAPSARAAAPSPAPAAGGPR